MAATYRHLIRSVPTDIYYAHGEWAPCKPFVLPAWYLYIVECIKEESRGIKEESLMHSSQQVLASPRPPNTNPTSRVRAYPCMPPYPFRPVFCMRSSDRQGNGMRACCAPACILGDMVCMIYGMDAFALPVMHAMYAINQTITTNHHNQPSHPDYHNQHTSGRAARAHSFTFALKQNFPQMRRIRNNLFVHSAPDTADRWVLTWMLTDLEVDRHST